MKRAMYPQEFFNLMLADIENLSKGDVKPYLSFLPMAILIEVLGKIKEASNDWNDNDPRRYFRKGIKALPTKYHMHSKRLYKSLRCGFAHSLLPQKGVSLTHKIEAQKYNNHHLDFKNDSLILISEDLCMDIKDAFMKIMCEQYLNTDKMSKPILYVPA